MILKKKIYICLCILTLALGCSKDNEPDEVEVTTDIDLPEDFKVVIVQPIIITNDTGVASFYDVDLEKINNAYSRAKVKFVFLKTKSVKNDAIYNGSMGLGEMKNWLSDNNHLAGDRDIVNLVCTENLAGSGGPIGRAEVPGSVTFLAFDSNVGSILNVFVVSHEVGHNFGLKHANEDENVDNELPNVMGNGDYEDRLNPKNSFNSYQIDIIRNANITHDEEKAKALIEKYNLE